ncbi:hypothetical protein JCM30760_14160 [Thiomicrorhabdus hydrogeniphila]
MLKLIDIKIDNAVAFEVSGKITEDDMVLVFNEIKQKIQLYNQIVLFEKIDSFNGVELAAMLEKFKSLLDIGLSNIVKIAIVTDKKWLSKIVDIEDKFFRKIEMKSFSVEEQSQAVAFLKGN